MNPEISLADDDYFEYLLLIAQSYLGIYSEKQEEE